MSWPLTIAVDPRLSDESCRFAGRKEEAGDDKIKQEIVELEREVGKVISRLDRKTLDRLFADDFVLVTAHSEMPTKAQVLESLKCRWGGRVNENFCIP
jgi:hypothetical protein